MDARFFQFLLTFSPVSGVVPVQNERYFFDELLSLWYDVVIMLTGIDISLLVM